MSSPAPAEPLTVAAHSPAKRLTVESAIQIVIMLAIGAAAGAASFTHVHDVAAAHGQAGWLAWADAVVLELMSVASGLEMRRRKRLGLSVTSPAVVLVISVTLSLSAQVVEAEASPIGWIAAAIPALGFLVMVKVALAQAAVPIAGVVPASPGVQPGDRCDLQTVRASVGDDPAGVTATRQRPAIDDSVPEHSLKPPEGAKGADADVDPVVVALIPVARSAAASLDGQGRRLSRHALAGALREEGYGISNARASVLLKTLKSEGGFSPVARARSRPALTPRPLRRDLA
jgi:hypothetical protein